MWLDTANIHLYTCADIGGMLLFRPRIVCNYLLHIWFKVIPRTLVPGLVVANVSTEHEFLDSIRQSVIGFLH